MPSKIQSSEPTRGNGRHHRRREITGILLLAGGLFAALSITAAGLIPFALALSFPFTVTLTFAPAGALTQSSFSLAAFALALALPFAFTLSRA